MSNYSIGSIWRKWDLHVHSPSSCLNNLFQGSTLSEKWEVYIQKLESISDISVIAITDYYSIDGFEEILKYRDRLRNFDLILPNVEMRLCVPTQSEIPINIHIIFNPEIINEFKDRFLPSLEFNYQNQSFRCTKNELISLGKRFRNDNTLSDTVAFQEGVNQFKVNLENLRKILLSDKLLRENIIIVMSNSSKDGVSGLQESNMVAYREDIYRFTDCIFSGNPNDRSYFLGLGKDSIEQIIQKYGTRKPCIHGSDAHSLDKICKPDMNRYTWIKANPTFQGLKQILFEPEERVFIGEKPEKLKIVEQNKTKYVDFIRIDKKTDSPLDEKWFESIELPINPDLVAIIGNKGSGKSALTDIIGLLGKSQNIDYFSFLHPTKFKIQNCKLAKHFYSSLRWLSGLEEKYDLSDEPDRSEDEKVKYIPQKYFEKICNLIETKQVGNEFDKEIKKVIFSHIKDEEKLRKETLDDLIKYKTEQIDREIDIISSELKEINQEIINLETKDHSEYVKSLESRLKTKQIELQAHENNRPEEKKDPSEDQELNKKTKRLNNKITYAEKFLEEIHDEMQDDSASETELNEKIGIAESLIDKLDNIEKYIKIELSSVKEDCERLKININEIIKYQIEKKPVIDSQHILKTELERYRNIGKILLIKEGFYSKKISLLKEQLDEPSRQYQAYKLSLIKWEKGKSEIIGNEFQQDSIKFIEKEINYVNNSLKKELQGAREKRINKSGEIYDCLLKKINIYENLYSPVKAFISHYEQSNKQFSFSAKIKEHGIISFIFDYINKSSKGSFYGDGEKIIELLLNKIDFSLKNDALNFLMEFISLLENDTKNNEKRDIVDQIKPTKKADLLTFYQDLFSLKYLQPYYSLCLNNNDISQLSPGEKGTVLLIFYLLIDKHDIPLIIDQPEENLDNESVYEMLVPAIRKAKKRRQIIIVTHNPNLAVVCNAEQIIKASIDKNDKNKVTYFAGSIEDFDINQNVINVLEGTWPAFTNRSSKYFSAKFDESNFDQTTWE